MNQNEHISKVQFHQPRMVLPVKLRYPVRKLTCVSRQTCLNKSGKRHSKPSMGAGTTIKTAAAPPVWVMPTLSLNASALRTEIVSLMCLVLSEPSRLLSSLIACASFFLPATLALQSRASHYMHVNNCALEAQRVFEAVWQVLSSWMAVLVPRSPQQPSLFKVVMNQICHILVKENIPYLDWMQ